MHRSDNGCSLSVLSLFQNMFNPHRVKSARILAFSLAELMISITNPLNIILIYIYEYTLVNLSYLCIKKGIDELHMLQLTNRSRYGTEYEGAFWTMSIYFLFKR